VYFKILLFPANYINFRDLLSITILTEDDYLERAEFITKILHDNFDDMVFVIFTSDYKMDMLEGINTILLPDVGRNSDNEKMLFELISTDFASQFNFVFLSNGENLGVFEMKSFLEKQVSYQEIIFGSTLESGILFSTKILISRMEEISSICQKSISSKWHVESWFVYCVKKIDEPLINIHPKVPSVSG